MLPKFWRALVLVGCLPAMGCIAQSNYADYYKGEVISSDQFNEASGWKLTGYEVLGGWLGRKDKLKGMALKQVSFDESRDFEMELAVEWGYEKGVWPKIYLGDYVIMATCLNQFGSCNTGIQFLNKPNAYGKYLDKSFAVAPEIQYSFVSAKPYLITVRKIESRIYFFIDKELVASGIYKPLAQKTVGVHTVRLVDFIALHYLAKTTTEVAPSTVSALPSAQRPPEGPGTVKPGGRYFALVMGVSEYRDNRLNLDHPSQDAAKIKEVLVNRYTFTDSTTFLVLNPTRQKILSELFRLRKLVGSRDNLLIFYAGHGYWDEAAQQGYWWPADATPDDPSNWLSNSDVREQIRSIKSGHTLLISDACFSGGIFKTRSANSIRDANMDVQLLYRLPSRRAITSGTLTAVPDRSVFFDYLARRLTENVTPYFASQQLFDSFRLAVINNSMAVPQDGVIAETGDEGGDFIFILKN